MASFTKINFDEVKSAYRGVEHDLLQILLPDGRVEGHEYVALNPTRVDQHLGSFRINMNTMKWADFATSDKGSDLISLWSYVRGINNGQAAKEMITILGVRG